VFYIFWLRYKEKLLEDETQKDANNLSPADYSIIIKGVPQKAIKEGKTEFLKEMLAQYFDDLQSACFTYDLNQFLKVKKNYVNMEMKLNVIDHFRKLKGNEVLQETGEYMTDEQMDEVYPPQETILCCIKRSKKNLLFS
jgi:hypothetical protein